MAFRSHEKDSGFTLVEILVAMALAGVVLSIITTLLVKTHEVYRQIDATESYERTIRDFDESFRNVIQSAISVRYVNGRILTPGETAGASWTGTRIDFVDADQGCLTFEVATTTGKPHAEYPVNVKYFTWRVGRFPDDANGKSSCVKQDSTTVPSWSSKRWGLNPPEMKLFDQDGAPITSASSGWDQSWYSRIKRIEYSRLGQDHGSGISSGENLPGSIITPAYS